MIIPRFDAEEASCRDAVLEEYNHTLLATQKIQIPMWVQKKKDAVLEVNNRSEIYKPIQSSIDFMQSTRTQPKNDPGSDTNLLEVGFFHTLLLHVVNMNLFCQKQWGAENF